MPRKDTRYTLVDNIQYFTIILPFSFSLAVTVQHMSHLWATVGFCSLFNDLFGPCYVNNTFDYMRTSVSEHKCTTFHRYRHPHRDKKTLKISQLYRVGLVPAIYRNIVSASKNTENCSHSFSGYLALSIPSQINGYTRTDWLSWNLNPQLSLPLEQMHGVDSQSPGQRNSG